MHNQNSIVQIIFTNYFLKIKSNYFFLQVTADNYRSISCSIVINRTGKWKNRVTRDHVFNIFNLYNLKSNKELVSSFSD